MPPRAMLALLTIAYLSPSIAASGVMSVGPATVWVENGHENDCLDPSGLCLVSGTVADPGSSDINTYQHLDSVTVAIDDGELESRGVDLLPDSALVFRPADHSRPNPFFRLVTEQVRGVEDPSPLQVFRIALTPRGQSIDILYVDPWEADGVEHHHMEWEYGRDHGFGYERIGPFRAGIGGPDTDSVNRAYVEEVCRPRAAVDCTSEAAHTLTIAETSTPNVWWGAEVIEAQLGDASVLQHRHEPSARDAVAAPLAARVPVALPQGALPRSPDARALAPEPATHARDDERAGPGAPAGSRPLDTVISSTAVPDEPPLRPTAILLAAGASLVLAVILAALYSRVTRADALASRARASILAALQERPQRVLALAQRLGLDRTTVEHHVRVLVKTGHASTTRVGRAVVITLPGQDAAGAVRSVTERTQEAVVRALQAHGGRMLRERLHEAMNDVPLRTRNHAISVLARRGLLRCEWDGCAHSVTLLAQDGAPA